MDELLSMSPRELTRLEVMQRLKEKRLTQNEAARMLGISTRQVKRLWQAYCQKGAKGLVSKRRGKPSPNRLDAGVVQQALDLIKEKYEDFGPTLAHEKLGELDGLELSRESVRQLMISERIWKPKRAKQPPAHPLRERRACMGELVQIDGSDHAWFEERGPKCTLLVFIDDASGQLMELRLVPEETTFAYFETCRAYFERFGKPLAFYSDRHGIFRVNQPRPLGTTRGLTQFGRAMQELGIQILCASSPQAKGRIERANQTLQDRLVKELRLRSIANMQAGNAYLPEFREDFNRRFAVQPRSTHNAHRPLLKTENLDLILTHQETRTLSKHLTVQAHQVIYQIQSDRPGYALRHAQVTVCENPPGEVTILYQDQPIAYTLYQKPPAKPSSPMPRAWIATSKPPSHPLRIPPGDRGMAVISMANPFRRSLPMAQTDSDGSGSLPLGAKDWAGKQKSRAESALPCLRPRGGAPVAPEGAEPYPPYECPDAITPFIHPSQRGHLYFAQKGTFLLCIDSRRFLMFC